jgi:hypothetical protein
LIGGHADRVPEEREDAAQRVHRALRIAGIRGHGRLTRFTQSTTII